MVHCHNLNPEAISVFDKMPLPGNLSAPHSPERLTEAMRRFQGLVHEKMTHN